MTPRACACDWRHVTSASRSLGARQHGPGRPDRQRRQFQDRAQARFGVLQRQAPPCSCATASTSASPSPEPGVCRAASPRKNRSRRARPVGRRHARPAVLHRHADPRPGRRGRPAGHAARGRELQRVVQQVDHRLPDQVAVAVHRQRAARCRPGSARVPPPAPVKLGQVGQQRARNPVREGGAAGPGLDLRDAQQRVEHRGDAVQVGHRPRRPPRAARPALSACSAASSSRARARVIGVRRSCAMLFDTSRTPSISRPIRSSMSLIVSARRSNSSPRPVTRTRRPRSPCAIAAAVCDTLAIMRRNSRCITSPPADRQHRQQRQRPQQRRGQQPAQRRARLHVAPDQQATAVRQVEPVHPRQVLRAGARHHQVVDMSVGCDRRATREVAGERAHGRVGQQVDRVVVHVAPPAGPRSWSAAPAGRLATARTDPARRRGSPPRPAGPAARPWPTTGTAPAPARSARTARHRRAPTAARRTATGSRGIPLAGSGRGPASRRGACSRRCARCGAAAWRTACRSSAAAG